MKPISKKGVGEKLNELDYEDYFHVDGHNTGSGIS